VRPVVHVYAHPRSRSFKTLSRTLNDANGLQTHFKFQLNPVSRAVSGGPGTIDVLSLDRKLPSKIRGLVVCEGSFSNGELLVELLPNRAYLSGELKLGQSPNDPSLRLFFLYQLIAAALTVGVGLSEDANNLMTHRPPVGCLWDWWMDANQRSAAMAAARICPACEATLRRHGDVGDSPLRAARQMLDYIRRTLLVGTTEIPNRILIAHGPGEDWTVLVDMLKRWNLPVDSFEAESTPGRLVSDRWQQMLNNARLAFAVMTPDDPTANVAIKRARQNVIHEIGLCHARLGIFDTIVLKADRAEKFSNIDGVIYITFREGRLAEQRGKIKDCLRTRGIL
jgi:CAP12/Pycsar effector protein, TIR domain